MGLRQITGLTCARCGKRYGERAAVCVDCQAQGLLEFAYDYDDAARSLDRPALERREPWMWRFRELLPLDELAETPSLQVGMTPVYGAPRLAAWAGLAGLWLKDEGRSPSGSVEDRASAMAAVQARESGRKVIAAASAGAALPSIACFAASTGRRAIVFTPDEAGRADADLAGLFGALVLHVAGPLEAARELCAEACRAFGWLDRTAAATPYPFEGKKTAGHEIAEQLSERMPDWVVVAADDALETIAAVAKGLDEMRSVGLAKAAPKLLLAVPEGTGARASLTESPESRRAGEAVKASQGESVTAGNLAEAARETAQRAAVSVDAGGALAVAGLKSAVEHGVVDRGHTALVLISGRARGAAPSATTIEVERELARVEHAARHAGLVR